MKRTLSIAVSVLLLLLSQISFAKGLRYSYKSDGITHISADYELVSIPGNDPMYVRVESVSFQDGTSAYVLYLNFEQKSATAVPKGVKMGVTLKNGKILRLEQIGKDSSVKPSFTRGRNKVYWNRTKYLVEKSEMQKMCAGVKSIDVITGWDPDDYIQMSFSGNEFSSVLASQCADIASAQGSATTGKLDRYSDNSTSLTIIAKPAVAKGMKYVYNVGMSYLYYKNTNAEDVDLTIQIGTEESNIINVEAPVVFTLADGTSVSLRQTRESENFLYLYPSIAEARKLVFGAVKSISIQTEKGAVIDTFDGNAFSEAADSVYETLMAVSPM